MSRLSIVLAALLLFGCGPSIRRFERSTVMWSDPDRQAFGPQPDERYAPRVWDAADNLLFRPAARVFAFETHGASTNVNALDEVPDSSWFTNRIGRHRMSPEEVALGACDATDPTPAPPWTVVEGKVDGATAGFVFEDSLGRRYVLKADRELQPEQATAADAIGAALYHAAGYFVPCNRVVLFEPGWIELDPDARIDPTHGVERDMTEEDLDEVYTYLRRAPDGRLRGLASLYLDGTPLGPWDYRGTWDEDPNDVVDHRQRRELRGMRVLNAWVDHWDARQHNTLSTWIEHRDGLGHVRHNLVDFGDTFGYLQGSWRRSGRFGHSEWLDTQHVVEDFLTLGIPTRPWDAAEHGPTWPVLGYFDVERFDPEAWRPNYWNGAFEAMDEHDAAWMARIIARFDRAAIEALAELGRWSDPRVPERLTEVLSGRRERVLERYLTRLSPLTAPTVEGRRLCLEDRAVTSGLRPRASRRYRVDRFSDGVWLTAPVSPRDGGVCTALPARSEYVVLRFTAATDDRDPPRSARVHLHTGRVVGLERTDEEVEL